MSTQETKAENGCSSWPSAIGIVTAGRTAVGASPSGASSCSGPTTGPSAGGDEAAMKIAVMPPARGGVTSDPQWMIPWAQHAERAGFEALVTIEHPLIVSARSSRYPYSESGRMPLPDDTP